ncbi:uncharacterized protein Z518_10227 [Rhinocladiella mackenziei CBS 650.93]|uniref:Uncharacterized protein n=1 Tax=Rhinocladiella mackenziei CBS 650.93 TaxID=1442369 RepID=A0A0D2ITP3_9EURO|nr:uncharacterized protein Z518_10227 [Rhinocladiella mackenziei CBS 650.93]KIX00090.1 hypothetical protein Z518_10227 [Rhinocladiella mackenziei CBS 650.93]
MSSELDRLRRELEEEYRPREEEQYRRIAAEEHDISKQRRREEEQHQREEERRRYNQRTGNTSLAEFLDACHVHLYQGLAVQHKTQSTQGTPANADRKLRPGYMVSWMDFPANQTRMWDIVMESDFISEDMSRTGF